jgi:hypothetical protein
MAAFPLNKAAATPAMMTLMMISLEDVDVTLTWGLTHFRAKPYGRPLRRFDDDDGGAQQS